MEPSTSHSKTRRRWMRLGGGAVGLALLLTGAVGALHLPFAAPLARRILPGTCPVGRGTPAQIDRAHAIGAAAIRSRATGLAPARRALGFELDKMRRGDLAAWAASHQLTCRAISGNDSLQRCTDVPAEAVAADAGVAAMEEITFEFQASGELVNVQTLRRHLGLAEAARTVGQLERTAAATLGPPSAVAGQPTVEHLSKGVLATYVVEHVFKDYRATVSATNLAPTGVMVREEYLSVR